MAILARVIAAAVTFLALNQAMPKSRPVDPDMPVEVTISLNGELATTWMRPGKITVERHTFKVWRNTLISCGPPRKGRRECWMVGDGPEPHDLSQDGRE